MMWWNGEGSTGGWTDVLTTLSTILFLGLVIYGAVWLARSAGRDDRDDRDDRRASAPEDILAERFARGDIDEVDYRIRIETLRTRPDVTPRR